MNTQAWNQRNQAQVAWMLGVQRNLRMSSIQLTSWIQNGAGTCGQLVPTDFPLGVRLTRASRVGRLTRSSVSSLLAGSLFAKSSWPSFCRISVFFAGSLNRDLLLSSNVLSSCCSLASDAIVLGTDHR